jgi:hypothetical protein
MHCQYKRSACNYNPPNGNSFDFVLHLFVQYQHTRAYLDADEHNFTQSIFQIFEKALIGTDVEKEKTNEGIQDAYQK